MPWKDFSSACNLTAYRKVLCRYLVLRVRRIQTARIEQHRQKCLHVGRGREDSVESRSFVGGGFG